MQGTMSSGICGLGSAMAEQTATALVDPTPGEKRNVCDVQERHVVLMQALIFPNIAAWIIPHLQIGNTSTPSGAPIFQPAMLVDPGVYDFSGSKPTCSQKATKKTSGRFKGGQQKHETLAGSNWPAVRSKM